MRSMCGEDARRARRVLLRIEDHDRQRSRREFEAAILEDLEWLGFVADAPPVRQSERGDIYLQALDGCGSRGWSTRAAVRVPRSLARADSQPVPPRTEVAER